MPLCMRPHFAARFCCAALLLSLVAFGATAHAQLIARHGLNNQQFQDQFTELPGGNRLKWVSGCASGDDAIYATIWQKSEGVEWVARHGITFESSNKLFGEQTERGLRPTILSGYAIEGKARYAAIYAKVKGPEWRCRFGMDSDGYNARFREYAENGFRPVYLSAFTADGKDLYNAIWEKREGEFMARHRLTNAEYNAFFKEATEKGFRPLMVCGYQVEGETRYAALFDKSAVDGWQARHGLTAAQYQTTFSDLAEKGFRLENVNAYPTSDGIRYAAIWVK